MYGDSTWVVERKRPRSVDGPAVLGDQRLNRIDVWPKVQGVLTKSDALDKEARSQGEQHAGDGLRIDVRGGALGPCHVCTSEASCARASE